jgi:hypothetical protein
VLRLSWECLCCQDKLDTSSSVVGIGSTLALHSFETSKLLCSCETVLSEEVGRVRL